MSSLLPTTHNFYWHKEQMFLLEIIISSKKINVGRLMERKILACARRTVESLFYPNLIRLLCEAEEVPKFDQEEEEFPLDPDVVLDDEEEKEEEGKKDDEKVEKEEKDNTTVKDPQGSAEVLMLLQQQVLKQEAVWVFLKAAHEWYTKDFDETILPPPVFPDWVLPNVGPSGHAHEKPNEPIPDAAEKKGATASAAKPKVIPRGQPAVMLDDDEGDETLPMESNQNDSTSNSSPVSSQNGVDAEGNMEEGSHGYHGSAGKKGEGSVVRNTEEEREMKSKWILRRR